jgi:signal transduction histidine kinase
MATTTPTADDREGMLRLSHGLVALHIGGVVLLILAVLGSVLWVSLKHNELAEESSRRVVRTGVASFRTKVDTLVRDYSIWDEAYDAVVAGDRGWLYSNIGTAATDIGTLDLIVFVNPATGRNYGWRVGSPEEGEPDLLPADTLAAILGLLEAPERNGGQLRSIFATFEGEPWAFSVAEVTPVDGPPVGVAASALPRQIHGLRISQERLSELGETLVIEDLHLADAPPEEQAAVTLRDLAGQGIGYVVWAPPRPGIRILRQIAVPLTLALAVAAIISAISSRYAVRSARSLEHALSDAKAADRSKTEFLSNVSHELRTPMNGILGATQLLEMTELNPEQRELVSVLFASAHAQMALITDLLDWTRLEGGNRRLQSEPFEPAAVLRDVAEMMRVAAARKKIDFETDYDRLAGLTVRGDERAFRQVVTNLVGNAVKFTETGRVELRAHASRHPDRAEVVVEVQDTGRGIPAEALPRIFERFYQVDGSLTRGSEGTGLGLSISQRLSEMMGGRIEVESEVGAGSTFTWRVAFEAVDSARGALDAA